MQMKAKGSTEGKLLKWEVFRPILGGYTICTVMSGSGARMAGMIATMEHQQMAVLGLIITLKEVAMYFGAALGSASLRPVVPPPVTATAATAATTKTVCG